MYIFLILIINSYIVLGYNQATIGVYGTLVVKLWFIVFIIFVYFIIIVMLLRENIISSKNLMKIVFLLGIYYI